MSVENNDNNWELFLDDYIIARCTGFQRVVHHPVPRGIVIPADKPWEPDGLTPIYVGRRSDGQLECYYCAYGLVDEEKGEFVGYAVSEDGIVWDKPTLGLVEALGSTENNLVPCGLPSDLGLWGNVSDPAKRFVLSLGDDSKWCMKLHFGRELPDFLHDPAWRVKLTEAGTKPSYKLSLHFWDSDHEEWVYMRQSPNHPPARCLGRWSTKDLQHWTVKPVLYTDCYDSTDPRYFDEIYGMTAVCNEGVLLGITSWFTGDQTRPDLSVMEHEPIGRIHMKGTMDVRVMVSRDWGHTWDRSVSREAWIPNGTEADSYDRCVFPHCAPLRMGEEDWFYFAAINGDHGADSGYMHDRVVQHQGALFVQKRNRYVSLRTLTTPQILITKPVKVTGRTLQLNVDGSHGEVRVGIGIDKVFRIFNTDGVLPNFMVCDNEGKTHLEEGYTLEDCQPIHADSIEHTVQFRKGPDLDALLGKTVRLYIKVQDADIYGFRFQ